MVKIEAKSFKIAKIFSKFLPKLNFKINIQLLQKIGYLYRTLLKSMPMKKQSIRSLWVQMAQWWLVEVKIIGWNFGVSLQQWVGEVWVTTISWNHTKILSPSMGTQSHHSASILALHTSWLSATMRRRRFTRKREFERGQRHEETCTCETWTTREAMWRLWLTASGIRAPNHNSSRALLMEHCGCGTSMQVRQAWISALGRAVCLSVGGNADKKLKWARCALVD